MYNFIPQNLKHEESNLAAVIISSENSSNQLVLFVSLRLSILIPVISSKS